MDLLKVRGRREQLISEIDLHAGLATGIAYGPDVTSMQGK